MGLKANDRQSHMITLMLYMNHFQVCLEPEMDFFVRMAHVLHAPALVL